MAKDPERFHDLYRKSSRFRRLVTMVEHAFKFTDLDVVKAYVDLFDPEPWLAGRPPRPSRPSRRSFAPSPTISSGSICTTGWRGSIGCSTATTWTLPARCASIGEWHAMPASSRLPSTPARGTTCTCCMRCGSALIQRLMLLAVRVPDFSDRHATTHDSLIVRLMHLEVEPAIELLAQIFPVAEDEEEPLDFGETATYRSAGGQSYLAEHQTIFRPIARDFELIRRISSGVIYHVGAVG